MCGQPYSSSKQAPPPLLLCLRVQVWVMHVGTGKVKAKLCVHKVRQPGCTQNRKRMHTGFLL